jgi:hypothetical protein
MREVRALTVMACAGLLSVVTYYNRGVLEEILVEIDSGTPKFVSVLPDGVEQIRSERGRTKACFPLL